MDDIRIVVSVEGRVYAHQRTSGRCCVDNMTPSCGVTATRVFCDSTACRREKHHLENIFGYPVNWRYIGDITLKEVKVILIHGSTVYELMERNGSCRVCDIHRTKLCADTCAHLNDGALCNTLGTLKKYKRGMFKCISQ